MVRREGGHDVSSPGPRCDFSGGFRVHQTCYHSPGLNLNPAEVKNIQRLLMCASHGYQTEFTKNRRWKKKIKCSLAIVWVGGALNKAHLGCTNRLTSTTGTPVCGGMIKHSQTPLSHFCRGCKHCDVSVVLCVSSRCNSAREARNLLSRIPSRNAACRSRGAAPSPARIKNKKCGR